LEGAAALPDLAKRPLLLRWIAQHPKAPAFLRMKLLSRMPWRVLVLIADDAGAHPQARSWSTERLQGLWSTLSLGERRSLAHFAPRQLWPAVWKVPDPGTLSAFLQNPKLHLEPLLGLLQPPLKAAQLEALLHSRWQDFVPIAGQILESFDRSLEYPDHGLVLGMAAPWIKVLPVEERLVLASRLRQPALRKTVRAWAGQRPEDLDPSLPPEEMVED